MPNLKCFGAAILSLVVAPAIAQESREQLDTTYISNDTAILLVAHPQRILNRKSKLAPEVDQASAMVAESVGIDVSNVRQFVAQIGTIRPGNSELWKLWTWILRFDKPVDLESIVDRYAQKLGHTKAEHNRETYYTHDSQMDLWSPNNRTLILDAERRILSFIDDPQGKGTMVSRMRRANATEDLLVEIDVPRAGPFLLSHRVVPGEARNPEVYPVIEQTIQKLKRISLTVNQTSDTPIRARFQAIDAETARELHDRGSVLLETAKRGWPKLRDKIRERPADKNTKLASALADEIDSVLPAMRLTVDEDQLLVRVEKEGVVDLAALLVFFMLID